MNLPQFNDKVLLRPTRSTPIDDTGSDDFATFFLRPTRLPDSKSVKNFFLMRPMKRSHGLDLLPENYHYTRYLRGNTHNPFWVRPTRSTPFWIRPTRSV